MSIYLGTTKISGAYTIAKNIGEVFYSQSSSAADNPGGLPLFTGEQISNADQLYPQFYNWVLNHPELCAMNRDYETSMMNWGICSYYVINDTTKSIKLPKLSSNNRYLIDSYHMGTEWYDIYSDGWCEQGGYYANTATSAGIATINLHKEFLDADYYLARLDNKGTLTNNSATQYIANFTETTTTTASFRMDTSSYLWGFKWIAKGYIDVSDYKKKEIYPWVFAYNSAVSASVAQAAQFQTALSSKLDTDLNNILDSAKNALMKEFVKCVTPNYSQGITVANPYSTPYTAPASGLMTLLMRQNQQTIKVIINGDETNLTSWHANVDLDNISLVFPVSKGDVITLTVNPGSEYSGVFYPFRKQLE